MYTRIRKLHMGISWYDIDYSKEIKKLSFFTLDWMMQGIFSFCNALELVARSIFYQTFPDLYVMDIFEESVPGKREILRNIKIPACVKIAFKKHMTEGFNMNEVNIYNPPRNIFRLDCISNGMKPFFCDVIFDEYLLKPIQYRFSLQKLSFLVPNVTHLNLYELEEYEINEAFCESLISVCVKNHGLPFLREIVFHRYQIIENENKIEISEDVKKILEKYKWQFIAFYDVQKCGYRHILKKRYE